MVLYIWITRGEVNGNRAHQLPSSLPGLNHLAHGLFDAGPVTAHLRVSIGTPLQRRSQRHNSPRESLRKRIFNLTSMYREGEKHRHRRRNA